MNDGITLTIDEIHAIRKAHSEKTKDMNFDEYKKLLDAEAAPVRLTLEHAKNSLVILDTMDMPGVTSTRHI